MTDESVPQLADLEAVKALASPRRHQIMQQLSHHGPATSAMLARQLGLNTGATSYHLRELARSGFVEEDVERSHGRERWWRAVRRDVRIPRRSKQDAAMRPMVDEMNRIAFQTDLELFERAMAAAGDLGEWADAFPYSRGTISVTLDGLAEFFEEYLALLKKYAPQNVDTGADERLVLTRFIAFPAPGSVADEAGQLPD